MNAKYIKCFAFINNTINSFYFNYAILLRVGIKHAMFESSMVVYRFS